MSSIMPANSMAAMTCVETVTPPANLPTVESSRALKAQIDEIIANNKDVDACKLDVGDLVQLALSFFAGEWRTLKDIGAFVVTKIAHYNSLAAEYFFVRTHYPASPTFAALTRGMEGYLVTLNTSVHSKKGDQGQMVYRMTPGAAYLFVQGCYNTHVKPTHVSTVTDPSLCPWKTLPFDVRYMIYKLVLKALHHRLKVGDKTIVAIDEHHSIPFGMCRPALEMPVLSKLLALLRVDKQTHAEAKDVFYKLNHFEFKDMARLHDFLVTIGAERRPFLRHVTVVYKKMYSAASAAKLLTECVGLQKFELIASVSKQPEGYFMVAGSGRKFGTLKSIPGLSSLKRLRGIQQFDCHLDKERSEHRHNHVDAFLRPLVTQPRKVKQVRMNKSKPNKTGRIQELDDTKSDLKTHQLA